MTNSSVLPVGTVLQGRVYAYKIVKVLGQGAFGITYLASTKMHGPLNDINVQVAVKEFFAKDLDSRAKDGSVMERTVGGFAQKYAVAFQHESGKLSKLKHDGIVKVLEAFEANGTYYYSMEYLPCGSLDEMVKGKGIPEEQALFLFRQVCESVAFMHADKMMHLDIKPKNIMLDIEGHPVLIDFGLSKQYAKDGEPETTSTIGQGTPGYAPIEQAYAHSESVFQSGFDIYALGGTLYKMLTGKTPPTADIILNAGFKEDELLKKTVSPDTISLIRKAMAPVSKDRFPDMKSFLQAINALGVPEVGPAEDPDDETVVITKPNPGSKPEPDTDPGSKPSGPVKQGFNSWAKALLWIVLLACAGRTAVVGLGFQYLTTDRIVFCVASFIAIIGLALLLCKRHSGLWLFVIGLVLSALFPQVTQFNVIWSGCLLLLALVALFIKWDGKRSAWGRKSS